MGWLWVVLQAIALLAATAPGWAADAGADRAQRLAAYRRPAEIPHPADNPYSETKAALGRVLFFDPIFSGSGVRSCATCHNPGLSWGDGLARAIGENQRPLAFRSPTILNLAWIGRMGWDGKFADLEAVAFTPITGNANMNKKENELIEGLSAIPGYRRAFSEAFPGAAISRRTIEQALAVFERTVVSPKAPFDRWVEGDERAVDEAAKRGFDLFTGKAQCGECHNGWSFTEGAFYDIGSALGEDIGRGRLFPDTKLRYAFKVPTLRDVTRRAPYMHDGSIASLEAVIELYDKGGVDRPSRSELIRPLGLTAAEKEDLIAFLATLTGEQPPFSVPSLPR
jgi:cytochrome c peroxidase